MRMLPLLSLSLAGGGEALPSQAEPALVPPAAVGFSTPLVPWAAAFPEVGADNTTVFGCSPPEALNEDWEGFVLHDLADKRCATVIRPKGKKKLGVVLCFHGGSAAGTDDSCATRADDQGNTLGDLAMSQGFALVVLQHAVNATSWDLPLGPPADKWLTNLTTTRCDTGEMAYWSGVMEQLARPARREEFALGRVFPLGISTGTPMATNAAICMREPNKDWPRHKEGHVSSFAVQGMGLFTEGDHHLPVYPGAQANLKACISSGTGNRAHALDLHASSVLLADKWEEWGNRAERFFLEGGRHDEVESWNKLLNCLDDTSGRLYATARDAHPQLFVDLSDA